MNFKQQYLAAQLKRRELNKINHDFERFSTVEIDKNRDDSKACNPTNKWHNQISFNT